MPNLPKTYVVDLPEGVDHVTFFPCKSPGGLPEEVGRSATSPAVLAPMPDAVAAAPDPLSPTLLKHLVGARHFARRL